MSLGWQGGRMLAEQCCTANRASARERNWPELHAAERPVDRLPLGCVREVGAGTERTMASLALRCEIPGYLSSQSARC